MLRYAFGRMLCAMGLHTIWQGLRARPLVIGYGYGHRITVTSPKWYHRALSLYVGLVFLIGATLFLSRARLF